MGIRRRDVLSLDGGTSPNLRFLGDIQRRHAMGRHAYESVAQERGVGFVFPGLSWDSSKHEPWLKPQG